MNKNQLICQIVPHPCNIQYGYVYFSQGEWSTNGKNITSSFAHVKYAILTHYSLLIPLQPSYLEIITELQQSEEENEYGDEDLLYGD